MAAVKGGACDAPLASLDVEGVVELFKAWGLHKPEYEAALRSEGVGGGTLFIEDMSLHRAPAWTAMLNRPVGGKPPLITENILPANVVIGAQMSA